MRKIKRRDRKKETPTAHCLSKQEITREIAGKIMDWGGGGRGEGRRGGRRGECACSIQYT